MQKMPYFEKDINIDMIKEIKGEECRTLRPLWEKVFFEDSKEFTDYYFEEKAGRNHAFTICTDEKEEGEVKAAGVKNVSTAAMLHLSPYDMEMRTGDKFTCLKVNYIVGVATEEKHRRKGYMGMLLKASMDFMYKQGYPFTFLMPASPQIYEPYQFVYIYNKKIYKAEASAFRREEIESGSDILRNRPEIAALKEDEISMLANYVNRYLKENYDVFIRRDNEYYKTLIKELKVQNGGIYLVHEPGTRGDGEGIAGYFLYAEEGGKSDVQEAVFGETIYKDSIFDGSGGFLQETGNKPAIMARIVNVKEMLSFLRTELPDFGEGDERNCADNIMLTIDVSDPMLEGNNGVWECRITREAAFIGKREKAGDISVCTATIDKLTSWVFGYRPPEECFVFPQEEMMEETLCKLKSIKVFSKVFINEIV